MPRTSRKAMGSALILLIAFLCLYTYRFYPRQQMPVGKPIFISTPEPEKYHNDCLHPCVRRVSDSTFVMVQSPYYAWDNTIENPVLYRSCSLTDWGKGTLLAETPTSGYNSDPNVFVEDTSVFVFWRVCGTPICRERGMDEIVIGGRVDVMNEVQFVDCYICNQWHQGDLVQCPILMKHGGKYLFYAAWYQYEPLRKNKGIAVWEGTSLEKNDFKLIDTVSFDNPLVCDKLFQARVGARVYYLPIPKRYDMWHFDLFEYQGMLFMVSCAERDDNIMLSVSTDWKHFKTSWKPLVNNHFSENLMNYRQYYYKPTAIVQNDSLYLYYTANTPDDSDRNQLFLSVKAIKDLMYH